MHYGIDVDIYMAAFDAHRSWVLALFAENKEISHKSLNLEWLWLSWFLNLLMYWKAIKNF